MTRIYQIWYDSNAANNINININMKEEKDGQIKQSRVTGKISN